ncbi:MAG: DNA replication and repair protein RecF, partial [Saprospiraceae bacterium]|nr:DNA replication and repair protein RecF [Saprospiraceae bacterium]
TMAMTRSNFSITDQQLIHDSADFFRMEGLLVKPDGETSIVMKLPKGKKKVIEQDGRVVPRALDHIGIMPVVMITPDDLNLINSSNSERRKLADSTLSQCDPQYLSHLVMYNRLLKQRNAQLKSWQEKGSFDPLLLEAYDHKMSASASYIYEARQQFFDSLLHSVQKYYEVMCEGREPVDLEYRSELAASNFIDLCRRNQHRDRMNGRTYGGVHRDVIDSTIDGRDAKLYGSQGQKKSLIFAIKLAQLDYIREQLHDQPIMLLDDVFDKLDRFRVDHLLSIILSDTFGQVFITDTQWQQISQMISSYDVEFQKFEIV